MANLTTTYKRKTKLNKKTKRKIEVYEEAKGILQDQQFWFRRHLQTFRALKQMFWVDLACCDIMSILCIYMLINGIMSRSLVFVFIFAPIFVIALVLTMICYDHVNECKYHEWHCQKNILDIDSTVADIDARIEEMRER